MGESGGEPGRSARQIALVGPFGSGKTSLLEALLARTGAVTRQGHVGEKNTLGDASQEAREHGMSVELNIADVDYLGDRFTLVDCPGSVEFNGEMNTVLSASDAAVVVCEPDEKKIPALQLILKQIEDKGIPHMLFLNKIDRSTTHLRDILPILQPASSQPLVLRQIPIWEKGIATGYIDLALERAYVYREHAPSEVIAIPDALSERESEARFSMLEQLADYDDALMEQLLEDIEPPRDQVFHDLAEELRHGQICPVLIGSAEAGHGILRLLKALRHDVPFIDETAARLGVSELDSALYVFKTLHTPHGGKLSVARVLRGTASDGASLSGPHGEERISGVFAVKGQEPGKRGEATAGETVALGRLENVRTGDLLALGKTAPKPDLPEGEGLASEPPEPVYGLALSAGERKDEVKLSAALAKMIDEDPSLRLIHNADVGGIELWGQGEMHLRVAMERLARKFGVSVEPQRRKIPYKESIRKSIEIRGRHKKQSGGHGQFGDVVLEIRPLPRGEGFEFSETITGGVVPKQYIPSVEAGARDYLRTGPLGFPVVDVAVCLKDGSYHSVDSSDQAFRAAGRLAMAEGMPQCSPVLLEPIMAVTILTPSEATPRINGIVSSRRGQILGFDARPGWPGWDVIESHIPEAELQDLIIELRSATSGVGTFSSRFDHLAELTGKLADQVVAGHSSAAAA